MKQQHERRDHLDPAAERRAGIRHGNDTMRPLMALAIIVAARALLVAGVAFRILPASDNAESMMIGA